MALKPAITEADQFSRAKTAPVIGLVGGVGSGKSTLARWLAARLNAPLIDADAAGHQALRDPVAREQIRGAFGTGVFDASGQIDRKRLATMVFGETPEHDEARQRLEAIVHPVIGETIETEILHIQAKGDSPCILLDAAVMFEAGWHDRCDYVIFVDAPLAVRQQRIVARGWDADTHCRREASQWPVEKKQHAADFSVSNVGELAVAGQKVIDHLTEMGVLKHPVAS